jgi:UDP-N-acetylmuramoyl-tripeptide--D-alanyl-D-alanine ligase
MASTPAPSGAPGFWTLDRMAAALRDLAEVNLPIGPTPVDRIWTDTRSVTLGDCLVALRGERFDAHEFLQQAVTGGARAVVVSQPVAGLGVPVFEVPDTLVALGALARHRRRAWARPVVAVAGTNGKTSTKELIRAALGAAMEVHATTGNLNNLVGVPLTLLALDPSADVAVVEMGTNQPGEVDRLRTIVEPDLAVITSVAEEHLEGLGDLDGVLREELACCDDVAVAVVPASQPEIADGARSRARRVVTAGLDAGDLRASEWHVRPDGTGMLVVDGVEITVPLRGVHNLRNAMLALAVAREFGVSLKLAAAGIAAMPVPHMRVNWETIGSLTLINDAYNSNPGSARAAIELLAHAGSGRQRVAVLGSMLELGEHAPRLHDEVARAALDAGIEVVAGIGEFAGALSRVAPGDPRVVAHQDPQGAWDSLASRVEPDAVILLKGSRGVALERLVPAITAWSARGSA